MARFRPGDVVDDYEIVELLGAGAYAETYKATNRRTGVTVVLKMPNPGLFADPGLFSRYQHEARVVNHLDHPGIQRGVDPGDRRTEPYLALEYIEGEPFRNRVQGRGHRVDIDQAVDWGRQLAEALNYLHRHGVVHRDLKPENVLLDKEGRLKISDFGTARLDGARRLTWKHLSEGMGTPDYMSPEQVQGERGDARSDIYAWGVMMYEMLAGETPFQGDNAMAVMAGHLQGKPKRIRDLRPEVPPSLEAVVLHAMRRSPGDRYQSTTELSKDLDHLDSLDPQRYDLSPEPAIGGMAAAGSAKRLWGYAGLIALAFIAVVAVILIVSAIR